MDLAWTCLDIDSAADAIPYATPGDLGAARLAEEMTAFAESFVTAECTLPCETDAVLCEATCTGPGGEAVDWSRYTGNYDSVDDGGDLIRTTIVVHPASGPWSRLTVIFEASTGWDQNQGSSWESDDWYVESLGTIREDLPADAAWQAGVGSYRTSDPSSGTWETWSDGSCDWWASYGTDVPAYPGRESWSIEVAGTPVSVTRDVAVCDGQRYATVRDAAAQAVDEGWEAVEDPCSPPEEDPAGAEGVNGTGCATFRGGPSAAGLLLGLLGLFRRSSPRTGR
jgi:hypothetical protein